MSVAMLTRGISGFVTKAAIQTSGSMITVARCRPHSPRAMAMSATSYIKSDSKMRQPAKRISDQFEAALNEHAKNELIASNTYLAMAHWFESINLEGFATFYEKQSVEEREHANKFYKHILKRGGEPIVPDLPKPKSGWNTIGDAVFFQLENERRVTKSIHKLLDQAHENRDYASLGFLQDFATYQVEEEDEAEKMYMKAAEYGTEEGRIYDLDAIAGTE